MYKRQVCVCVCVIAGLLVYLLYGAGHSQAGSAPTYTPLPSTQISMVLDDNDDIDSDEETALLNN